MSTRSEKEKQKVQQEKFQAILSNLLKDDDNKYCVDCDAKGPRWASWNLGIFLCIRCAGIHRNLGVHISKVKSVNLDTWSPEQIAMMMEIGNSRARAAYEANLPDNYRRPQANGALESFIRAKYESKKYMAKEWVPPKPSVPKELLEDDKDKKKAKPKSGHITLSSVPRVNSEPQMATHSSKPANPKPVQNNSKQASTPQQSAPPPPPKSSTTGDLIGLDAPTASENTSSSLLDDFMGSSTPSSSSQPATQTNTAQVSNGSLEANLFGETPSTEKTSNVSTKDSIMALFGGSQQTQQQFGVPANTCSYTSLYEEVGGVMSSTYNTNPFQTSMMFAYAEPGGVYMPQQQQMGPGMYNMQQPQQQQQQQTMPQMNVQQGMYGNQMGMMGMPQGQIGMSSMGAMPQGQMGMQQGMIGMPGAQMGMYGQQQQQQPQMQQMQFQQMQQQMGNMNLGQPQMGMGWSGPQSSGHTLSTNLWQ
ncbi:stromal membrane-associated protein 1-like isoform X2 [Ruditapes philippinarum]|uniref:stromal membrane-associated protein 1-like isoform X2 n=1 Tax=Ruditapes philippinarum TaxID=129788 RepID=UPI00295AC528|nr:stromal membrane-associated protein 1-like isoform X2 [Ruditapes philippinarum]